MRRRAVTVSDRMQQGYSYVLTEPAGKNFDPSFKPELSPQEMLALGVFGGVYMRDCKDEFPKEWFKGAKFQEPHSYEHDGKLNCFKVNASQPLSVWRAKGWINEAHDPRGWFQWYCRYWVGRRIPLEDARQIRRWRAIARHSAQVKANCAPGDVLCRPRQRQAILHWAYDSRNI